MTAINMAKELRDLLLEVIARWNRDHPEQPLRKLSWEQIDPINQWVNTERCVLFLAKYEVRERTNTDTATATKEDSQKDEEEMS